MSPLVDSIPDLKQLVGHGNRSFITFVNKFRSDAYASEAQNMWDHGERDPAAYQQLGSAINHQTGWSNVQVGEVLPEVNAAFSIKRAVSLIQTPMDLLDPRMSASARMEVAKSLAAFTAFTASSLAAMDMFGVAKTNFNPLSTDFGTATVGNQHFDLTGGERGVVRTMARLILGQANVNTHTGPQTLPADRFQTIRNFLLGKANPALGFGVEAASGQNLVTGQPFSKTSGADWRTAAFNTLTPIFFQDMINAARIEGAKGIAPAAPVALLGGGASTYTTPSGSLLQVLQSHSVDPTNNAAAVQARAQFPDVAKAYAGYQQDYFSKNPTLKTLYDQQTADDAKLAAGQLTAAAWVKQMHDRQNQTVGAQAQKYQGQGQQATGIGVVDKYLALRNDPAYQNDQQALYEAQDAYRAGLSPADRQTLDDHIGWGGLNTTPMMQEYHQAVKQVADSGYFNLRDEAVQFWAKQAGQPFTTYAGFMKALTAEAAQWHARPQDAQAFKDVSQLITQGSVYFRQRNPQVDALLDQWYGERPQTQQAASLLEAATGLKVAAVAGQ